jgi:plastocyanin
MTNVVHLAGSARREVLRITFGAAVGVIATLAGREPRAADRNRITIHSFAFMPKTLTVKVGTTVTWTNQDQTIHSIVCPGLKLKSDPLDTNDSFSYVFREIGNYEYSCGLHPFMKGQVVVTR